MARGGEGSRDDWGSLRRCLGALELGSEREQGCVEGCEGAEGRRPRQSMSHHGDLSKWFMPLETLTSSRG